MTRAMSLIGCAVLLIACGDTRPSTPDGGASPQDAGSDAGGGEPTCRANEVPRTCEPACDAAGGEYCDDGTCQTIMECDPTCVPGTEFCNVATGLCEELPAVCSPSCATGEYCDDGTCREIPVCDPPCTASEHCGELGS